MSESRQKRTVYSPCVDGQYVIGFTDPLLIDFFWPLVTSQRPTIYYQYLIGVCHKLSDAIEEGPVIHRASAAKRVILFPRYLKLTFIFYLMDFRPTHGRGLGRNERDPIDILCDAFSLDKLTFAEALLSNTKIYIPYLSRIVPSEHIFEYMCSAYLLGQTYFRRREITELFYEFLLYSRRRFALDLFSYQLMTRLLLDSERKKEDDRSHHE